MIIPQHGKGAQQKHIISRWNMEKVNGLKNAPPHAGEAQTVDKRAFSPGGGENYPGYPTEKENR